MENKICPFNNHINCNECRLYIDNSKMCMFAMQTDLLILIMKSFKEDN